MLVTNKNPLKHFPGYSMVNKKFSQLPSDFFVLFMALPDGSKAAAGLWKVN